MIDHTAARETFATSLDFPLEAAERDVLDGHLRDCAACRSFAASMRADSAVLRDLDFGPVPIAVRANVAIAAEKDRRGGLVGRGVLLAAAGALLLVAIGGGVLSVGSGPQATGLPGLTGVPAVNDQISWRTDVVALTAREFSIVVGGVTFRAATPKIDIHSDPGNATYRTLEATWQENGVEMRLYLYFGGDESAWWVDEVRIYNGAANGDWLAARGIFFKTPLGAAWAGDQDIAMGPGVVHFAGMTLAMHAFDGVNEPPGGGIDLPENAQPFAAGGVLHCSGILQLPPLEAEKTLLALGYRLSWRLMTTTGPNTGFAEAMPRAPGRAVIMQEPPVGNSGELIMFAAPPDDPAAKPVPYPSDCPDPNRPATSEPGAGPVLAPSADAFLPGGRLHCSGILQMSPPDAERALSNLGYKLRWHNQVTGEQSDRAFDGVITVGPFVGASGELMLFVVPKDDSSANPIPFPVDCPTSDPNITLAPPVP